MTRSQAKRVRGGWNLVLDGRDAHVPDGCLHPQAGSGPCRECVDDILWMTDSGPYAKHPLDRTLNWIDLTAEMPEIERRAGNIRDFHGKRATNPDGRYTAGGLGDIIGKMGERTYSLHFDLPWPDDFNVMGDGGTDFPGVDVKSSQERPPVLRVRADRKHHHPDRYALVAVRYKARQAAVWGEVPGYRIAKAPVVRKKLSRGGLGMPSHVLFAHEIPPLRQPGIGLPLSDRAKAE